MSTLAPARTYNQNHVPRKYTAGKRRLSIYWTWSYPWESQRDPASMENRFSTMTEVRNVLWPEYETPEWSAAQFLQGIAGTLELFHRSTLSFQEIAGEVTGHPVAVFQRIDQAGYKLPIDERILADTDTLLVFGLDHLLSEQEASPEEIAAIREEDTDWKRWLLGRAPRPFNPRMYFEFRIFKDFSGGITDQWYSRGSGLAHFYLDTFIPDDTVSNGGIFAWHDVRENPDTFQCSSTFADKQVLYTYSTFKSIFEVVGFSVVLYEYFDERGTFHYNEWDPEDGKINRSKRFDERNNGGELKYTSIIMDAKKE
jgi:hypothetical protein